MDTPSSLLEDEVAELVATRRDLHRHPELAYAETRTARLVAERLAGLGLVPRTGVAGTGVVADVVGAAPGPCVLLRADMDALPIQEANDLPWRSVHAGRMHACGHDGHTAILLAAARLLSGRARPPRGTVRLVFQPAEEGGNGAAAMIAAGVLEGPRVDAAFGLHLWNHLDRGRVAIVPGPFMAAVDRFVIRVQGQGGHGAVPHRARDPIVAAAHVVTALQAIAARRVDPEKAVVVTVGSIAGGHAFNVIPDSVRLEGTARSFDPGVGDALAGWITDTARGACEALGCTAEVSVERLTRATVNDPAMAALVHDVACARLSPADIVQERTMAGEDFAEFLAQVPGCFFFVGTRDEATGKIHPHHSPHFDIDERALPVGAGLLVDIARTWLERAP